MFQVRDTVSHGMDGVCTINAIIEKKVNGTPRFFYEIQPVHKKEVLLYLPVDNQKAQGSLRYVLTRDQVLTLIHGIPEAKDLWIESKEQRKESFRSILRSGDLAMLLALTKTICSHRDSLKSCGRKLHTSDEACLKDAEKLIMEELSYVLGIAPEQLDHFIRSELGID